MQEINLHIKGLGGGGIKTPETDIYIYGNPFWMKDNKKLIMRNSRDIFSAYILSNDRVMQSTYLQRGIFLYKFLHFDIVLMSQHPIL